MSPELIKLVPGDVVITAQRGDSLPWAEDPPSSAGLEERPGERAVLQYEGNSIAVPITVAEAFAAVRDVYIVSGRSALEKFLRANNLVDRVSPEGPGIARPEDLLSGNQLLLARLITPCVAHLDALRASAIGQIQELAHQAGLVRLKTARNQIEKEVRRYFAPDGGRGDAMRALNADAELENFSLRFDTPSVRNLRQRITTCRELIAQVDQADRKVMEGYRLGRPMDEDVPMFDWDNPDQPEPAIKFPVFLWTPDGRLQEAVHGPFGPMAPLEENAAAARARLHDYVAVATVEFPVFSKLFDAERVDTPVALEKAIWTILRTTHTGNLAFSAVLEADAGLVWHYRPIVEEAMNSNYVPMFSIARTAAEEKLTETIGAMRLSTKLAMTSGLAALGATGIAALAGAGAAAPPLVVAVLVVDGAINLYDLYEEYREYRRQSAAFHATLDPTLALASEPSVVMFAVNAGLTVISIIPGAGSGKAAPKALSAVP